MSRPDGLPEVSPPGSEDWETTAAAWLLDLVPEYRQRAAVRRHPVILAFIARHVIAGAVEGALHGYWVTRSELATLSRRMPSTRRSGPWRAEGERLAATASAVDLVERALRGEPFRPRLQCKPVARLRHLDAVADAPRRVRRPDRPASVPPREANHAG
jgi:hypothetical protein